ncbi:NUDIX domain-containing protein [Kineosporia babensis]|uniref:NUDIX domain-containing protein n=1 Tax=Kineosporia babensis TaxID=499548 RepID=A0A9X1NEL4_9ACTN|nr:NUDIX domain-containing protein [Kineosporia babensis]MCD5311886.1 NUDIX domain-containing protein [Kineosporia babensis]
MTNTALPAAIDSHTLLVAAVIVHDQSPDKNTDSVLLLRRAPGAKFAPLLWDLPSGKADKGESITAAAVRELREETGLEVDESDLQVSGIIHGAWGIESPNGYLTVVFATRRWRGEAVNTEPHKHDRLIWTPVDQLPTEFVPTTGATLNNYLTGGPMVHLRGF